MMTLPSPWTLASSPEVHLLGWTLLHVVWQGALLAAVLAVVLSLLRNHAPQARYAVSCVALVAILAMPVGTAVVLHDGGRAQDAAKTTIAVDAPELATLSASMSADGARSSLTSWQEWTGARVRPLLPWIVFGWGVGVLVSALRFAGGAWRIRSLRRNSTPASERWQDRLQVLADQMGITSAVTLRRSTDVDSPAVVGWFRPVVLVPAGLLSGLPPEQVAALLRHELAHIRRHDVLVGRLQALAEAVLFFHPATWWISRQVRQTRELCCDQVAVRSGADRTAYAYALASLAERAASSGPTAWTPAAGDGSLLSRIRHTLRPASSPSDRIQRVSTVLSVILVVAVPIGLAACASQQSATEPGPNSPSAQTTEDTRAGTELEREQETGDASAPSTDERVIVITSDSTKHSPQINSDGPIVVDSLEEDVYVFRYRDRIDTIDVPHLEQIQPPFPPDSLERLLRGQFNPDSLERELKIKINPDSLERILRARINVDSLHRELRMRFDVDSLEQRALRMRFRADSVNRHLDSLRLRWERDMPEHLREQARRLREQAKHLEERAEEMEAPPAPSPPEAPDAQPDTSSASGGTIGELHKSEAGVRSAAVQVAGRDTTLVAEPLIDPGHTVEAPTEEMVARLRRRAMEGNGDALDVLVQGSHASRPSVQTVLREIAQDPDASDVNRWKAFVGLSQHGGTQAQRILGKVKETTENPELRRLAARYLEQARNASGV